MQREFTAVFKHNDPWWIGWSPELEGAYGQGRTLEEARESLREAIQLVLEDIAAQEMEQGEAEGIVREKLLVPVS